VTNVAFLTEIGLYEVLFRSRKPIAKKFKKWVCEVIREIRLTGQYKLEKELKKVKKELDITKRNVKNIEYKEVKEGLEIKISENEQRVIDYFPKIVYAGIAETITINGVKYFYIKFGYTNNVEDRLKTHKKEIGSNFTFEIVIPSLYNIEIEKMIKKINPLNTRIVKEDFIVTESGKKIYGKIINGKLQTEIIKLDNDFTINDLRNELKNFKEQAEKNLEKEIERLEIENRELKLELKEKERKIANINRHITSGVEYPITSKNLRTGKELEFDNLAKVQFHYKIDFSTLRKYIDQQKQYKGIVFRSGTNKPYWVPPEDFNFNESVKPSRQTKFIKRVDKLTGNLSYYNSITEASLYLQKEIDKKEISGETKESIIIKKSLGELLRGFQTKKQVINKYEWYKMKSIGFMVNPDGTRENIDVRENESQLDDVVTESDGTKVTETMDESIIVDTNKKENISQNTKIKKKTKKDSLNQKLSDEEILEKKIPIIVRDIKTNKEIVHPEGYSFNTFVKDYHIRNKQVFLKYLNSPLNYRNLSFRTLNSPYWKPPKNYISNETHIACHHIDYFIKVNKMCGKNKEPYYYSNIVDVTDHLFPNDKTIGRLVDFKNLVISKIY
jgi:predicted GIY-YIG superfamily endonuclease